MSVITLPFHWSPSADRTFKTCGTKGFWSKVYGGKGLQATGKSIELELGKIIHQFILESGADQPAIDCGVAAEQACEALMKDMGMMEPLRTEYPIFTRAVVYAFRSRVWPNILRDYEVMRIEGILTPVQEFQRIEAWAMLGEPTSFKLPWNTRPDAILRHRATGGLRYWDLKSTALDPSRFCRGWDKSPQLHMGAWAWEQVHGEPIEACKVQGVHKGSTYKGSLRGPFITLYRSRGPLTKPVFYEDYGKGRERGLISEYPGGVEAWVDQLPDATIAENFPCTPDIVPDPVLQQRILSRAAKTAFEIREYQIAVENLLRDTTVPEGEVEASIAGLMDYYFPADFPDACENQLTGRKCVMYELCWNPKVRSDPEGSGLFELKQVEEIKDGID